LITGPPYDGAVPGPGSDDDGHWMRWHRAYEDPASPLSTRLRLVQDGVRAVLDHHVDLILVLVAVMAEDQALAAPAGQLQQL